MTTCDRLQSDTSIPQGFSIVSKNQKYYTKVQSDGELVLYDKGNNALWKSNSANKGVGPFYLRMHLDGNLCFYGNDDVLIWNSNTKNAGSPPYQVKMQDDGNFCLFDTTGKIVWSTNTAQKEGDHI